MKNLVIACLLIGSCFLMAPVFAQDDAQAQSIIDKAFKVQMFQITANMKLSTEQIAAVEPIIKDSIVKVRDLQLSLQHGDIDGKTMYQQKLDLLAAEDRSLSKILDAQQMKIWQNMQND